jgi:hypothetical protein
MPEYPTTIISNRTRYVQMPCFQRWDTPCPIPFGYHSTRVFEDETLLVLQEKYRPGYAGTIKQMQRSFTMKNTKFNKILLIVMSILGIGGAIFLGISFFADNDSTLSLRIALACVDIAAILNVIQVARRRKEHKD